MGNGCGERAPTYHRYLPDRALALLSQPSREAAPREAPPAGCLLPLSAYLLRRHCLRRVTWRQSHRSRRGRRGHSRRRRHRGHHALHEWPAQRRAARQDSDWILYGAAKTPAKWRSQDWLLSVATAVPTAATAAQPESAAVRSNGELVASLNRPVQKRDVLTQQQRA